MVSAGNAGTPSTMVASTFAGRPLSCAGPAGVRLAAAGLPLAETSSFPPAGVPLGDAPPSAVPSDTVASGGGGLAEADVAAADWRDGCLGGAMMSLDRASWSSITSSPVAREVTTVGEPPPEPSGLSVRLSKPSLL